MPPWSLLIKHSSTSPNKVQGGSTLTVFIRKSERGGENVYFKVDSGQILCHVSDCSFNLKVGDGKLQKVRGLYDAAGNSDVIFAADAKRMKRVLAEGKPFKVEISFYQYGDRAFQLRAEGSALAVALCSSPGLERPSCSCSRSASSIP